MARYDITDIHYMSSGCKRGFVNIDVRLGYSKRLPTVELLDSEGDISAIMTETGDYEHTNDKFIKTKDKNGNETRISLEESKNSELLHQTQDNILSVDYDNRKHIEIRREKYYTDDVIYYDNEDIFNGKYMCTYEFEKIGDDNRQNYCKFSNGDVSRDVLPLNDVIDVTVRASTEKEQSNTSLPKQLDENSSGKELEIYYGFNEYPVQFCQFQNDSIMVTDTTKRQPYYMRTDLLQNLADNIYSDIYTCKLKDEPLNTYLYHYAQDYGAQNYRQVLSSDISILDSYGLSRFFNPGYSLRNIDYNYILNIKQNGKRTYYKNGEVTGEMFTCKNSYNSTYSMDMPSQDRLTGCRKYCGIQNSSGRPMLKYYDNIEYDFNVQNSMETEGTRFVDVHKSYTTQEDMYPYQKVEYFYPTESKSSAKHKSTLFSVQINNSGLADEQSDRTKNGVSQLKANLRKTITNAVHEFSKNICPANTQLFEVYYRNQE